MFVIRFLVILCLTIGGAMISPATLAADPISDFHVQGLSLNRVKGRTLVGVTRDKSKTWSLYLARNKKAYFHFSSGRRATATWEQKSRNIICFKGLIKDKPWKSICKLAKPRGRGMDWQTVTVRKKDGALVYNLVTKNEHRGSSQIVYSLPGRQEVNQNSYVSDLRQWPGHVVIGRTLKDREAWFVVLDEDGKADFVFGSGKRYQGRYTVSAKQICFTFAQKTALNGCRKPTLKKGKIMWASSKNGGYISEIVFLQKLPKIPQGFQQYSKLSRKKFKKIAVSANGNTVAAIKEKTKGVMVWDTRSGKVLFSLNLDARAMAFSPKGWAFAVATENSLRVFNTYNAKRNFYRKVSFVPRRLALSPEGKMLAVAGNKGGVRLFDTEKYSFLHEIDFESDRVTSILFLAQDRLLVGLRSGELYTVDLNADYRRHRIDTLKGAIVKVLSDLRRKVIVAVAFNGEWRSYRILNGGIVAEKQSAAGGGYVLGADLRSDGAEMSVTTGDGIRIYAVLDLTRSKVLPFSKNEKKIAANYAAPAGGMVLLSAKAGLEIWAQDRKTFNMLANRKKQFAPSIRARKKAVKQTIKEVKDREEKKRKEREKKYQAAIATANGFYNAGACDLYESVVGALKPEDKRSDCLVAQKRRADTVAYNKKISLLQCDAAAALRVETGVGGKFSENKCREKKQLNADRQRFDLARQTQDCKTVAELQVTFTKTDAAANCRLDVALASPSVRKAYFAAIKFDAAKDRDRARQLYNHIMEEFPDDDLALDAAQRLLVLNDKDDADQKQSEAAAALATATAAVDSANRAKDAAEKRARKEAEAARKATKAREQAERKAANARAREAEARARAAQARANANRRNTACDYVTVGQKFEVKGGGLFGLGSGYYRVIGISRVGGVVTAQMSGTDLQRQFHCSQVK